MPCSTGAAATTPAVSDRTTTVRVAWVRPRATTSYCRWTSGISLAWTLGGPHSVSLEVTLKDPNKLSAVNGTGESFRPKVESGHLVLDLTSAPQYVTLGEGVFR